MAEEPIDLDKSFSEGESATQQIFDTYRHNLAMNALVKQYGPVAGDPEAWKQNQENYLAQQLDPFKVQAAQRENTGDQSLVTQYGPQAGANPEQIKGAASSVQMQHDLARQHIAQLQATAGQDGSIPQSQIAGLNFADYGITDPATQKALAAKLALPSAQGGGTALLGQISNSLLPWQANATSGSTTYGTDAQGNTIAVSRTKAGQPVVQTLPSGVKVVPQERIPIAQQNANANTSRANSAQENANTNEFNAGTRANNSQFGNPTGQQQPSVNLIGGPGNRTQDTGTNVGGTPVNGQRPLFDTLPPKGRQAAVSQAQQIAAQRVNLGNANAIADSMQKQITPYTTGPGVALTHLPGTVAKDLERNAETLRAQAAQMVMGGMKNAQGQTGVGRILQAEYKNFTNMYGNLEQDQSTKQYAYHLGLLRQSLNRMQEIQEEGFHAMYGRAPTDVVGGGQNDQGWKISVVK